MQTEIEKGECCFFFLRWRKFNHYPANIYLYNINAWILSNIFGRKFCCHTKHSLSLSLDYTNIIFCLKFKVWNPSTSKMFSNNGLFWKVNLISWPLKYMLSSINTKYELRQLHHSKGSWVQIIWVHLGR